MLLGAEMRNKTESCRSLTRRQIEHGVDMHNSHFCLSSLLANMRGEKITHGRLSDGGKSAARAVFADVCAMLDLSGAERAAAAEKIKVSCAYKGTTVQDAPLHSQQSITYEWSINGSGPFEHKSCVNKTADIQVCTTPSCFLPHAAYAPFMYTYLKFASSSGFCMEKERAPR